LNSTNNAVYPFSSKCEEAQMRVDATTTNIGNGTRWGRIPDAMARCGLKRGFLYQMAAENPGLFRKVGAATVVDLWRLDEIIDAAPAADL
jgi:hypothetical protein